MPTMGFWDIMLLICVTAMGTVVAYLRSPHHKALIICFPVPFTLATLALGEDVHVTHIAGLGLVLGFWFSVYWLRAKLKVPIIVTILLSATAYCGISAGLAKLVPKTEVAFWGAAALVLALAAGAELHLPHRLEPEHRSRMPVWIKLPVLASVVLCLISMKTILSGFMTVFPMVGVLTAYEARHSLWTVLRQIPVMMCSFLAMAITIHVVTPLLGIHASLGIGWISMGLVLASLLRYRKNKAPLPREQPAA